ncbi:MAG: methyltransferase [Dehalococcoidia bacterium]|nr:methyltransferase [Dehalococcoidia bacterium]MQG15491.1 methyltransferase [SAR202 cluster bacterium]|tara:strand:- start:1373 stop:2014 length:642 start_codon:yes stop_codon:yes gene_type:complete
MLTFVPQEIEDYSIQHTSKLPGYLTDLMELTKTTRDDSMMLSGPIEGTFLQLLVICTRAKRILEIGTFTGFSAQMMAAALPKDGQIITCDIDSETAEIANEYFLKSEHGFKIDQKLGPALETMASLESGFDIIFIDADKENYSSYYERSLELLSDRGMIVIDNVLWGGRVLNPQDDTDKAIASLNERIKNDSRIKHVMLPIRDGVMLVTHDVN